MTFLLVSGIIFVVVPVILIQAFAFVIFLSFVRDDEDANNIFRVNVICLIFGLALIASYFIVKALN